MCVCICSTYKVVIGVGLVGCNRVVWVVSQIECRGAQVYSYTVFDHVQSSFFCHLRLSIPFVIAVSVYGIDLTGSRIM